MEVGLALELPRIDLSAFLSPDATDYDKTLTVKAWDDALSTFGFVAITGHGLDQKVMDELQQQARAFFAQGIEEKLRCKLHGEYGNGGYSQPGIESTARSQGDAEAPPDLVETFEVRGEGNVMQFATDESKLPHPAFVAGMRAYYSAAERLNMDILRLSALALGLEERFFEPYHRPIQMDLRLAHYPFPAVPPGPKQQGYGAHVDYLGMTLLCADSEIGGLQVRLPGAQVWRPINPIPGALIVNSGALTGAWTNGRWPAVWHRVLPPAMQTHPVHDGRLSIVMFSGPSYGSTVECIPTCIGEGAKHGPIHVGEFFQEQLRRTLVSNSGAE